MIKQEHKRIIGLALLGILVVASVAYVSFSVVAPKPAPVATQDTKSRERGDEDRETKSAQESDKQLSLTDVAIAQEPLPRRDPFIPQPLPGAQLDKAAMSQPERVSKPANKRFSVAMSSSRVPAIDVRPINPFASSNRPSSLSQTDSQSPSPEDEIVVTGVIRGDNNVAIVRLGQTGRYVVSEGQVIDGRYKVASILTDRVVFIHNNQRVAIKVGGNQNGK